MRKSSVQGVVSLQKPALDRASCFKPIMVLGSTGNHPETTAGRDIHSHACDCLPAWTELKEISKSLAEALAIHSLKIYGRLLCPSPVNACSRLLSGFLTCLSPLSCLSEAYPLTQRGLLCPSNSRHQ